jgi:acetyl esterase/lipase
MGSNHDKPQFLPDGTVHVPGFALPVSRLLSEPAIAFQKMRATMPSFEPASEEPDVAVRREEINAYARPGAERMREQFPVTITRAEIGGVEVLEFAPEGGVTDPDRVLINLHGGAFCVGWDGIPMLESIPIAALGGWRVVSVNYRMAPEYRHPAGGSAGGVLTAQAAAWLPAHGLPQAGAVGIFGAGGVPFEAGESMFTAGYIDGSFPPPALDRSMAVDMTRGYFADVDDKDPSAWPGWHLDVLAQFPPTLIITGTRAMDLSPAIYTNSQLLKAGVRSTLIVGESMGHCYYYQVSVPEGRDACDQIVRFFRENLA